MIMQQVRIDEIDVRVQWDGNWDEFYPGAENEGFPGIRIPLGLTTLAEALSGVVFPVDLEEGYWEECRKNVSARFAFAARGIGPTPGATWSLIGAGSPTTSGSIKWKPTGVPNGLAFEIGKTIEGSTTPFIDSYAFDEQRIGNARFWISFVLLQLA